MYKKIAIILFIITLGLLAYINFYTQEDKIGIIDMNVLIEKSTRAQLLQEKLEEEGELLEQKYESEESELDPQKKEEQIYVEFMQSKQEIENRLNKEIQSILDNIIEEENYSVILYKEQTYYGGEDITEKVIQLLDEKYANENN